MFNSSALNTTIALASLFATYASAANSVDNYTGTIADLSNDDGDKKVVDVTVAIEVVQTGLQVTYEYTIEGAFGYQHSSGVNAGFGLCYPTDADAYDCVYMIVYWDVDDDNDTEDWTNYLYRVTGVTKANAQDGEFMDV